MLTQFPCVFDNLISIFVFVPKPEMNYFERHFTEWWLVGLGGPIFKSYWELVFPISPPTFVALCYLCSILRRTHRSLQFLVLWYTGKYLIWWLLALLGCPYRSFLGIKESIQNADSGFSANMLFTSSSSFFHVMHCSSSSRDSGDNLPLNSVFQLNPPFFRKILNHDVCGYKCLALPVPLDSKH